MPWGLLGPLQRRLQRSRTWWARAARATTARRVLGSDARSALSPQAPPASGDREAEASERRRHRPRMHCPFSQAKTPPDSRPLERCLFSTSAGHVIAVPTHPRCHPAERHGSNCAGADRQILRPRGRGPRASSSC